MEEPHGLEQQVVEVERGGRAQPRLIAPKQPGDLALPVGVRVLGQEVGVDHLVLRPRDGAKDRARLVLAGDRQVFLAQDLLHQRLLVVRVVDDEVRVEADGRAVAAQHAGTQGMEGAHGDLAARLLTHQAHDAGPKLRGGLVGEGDGEDLPRPDALDADEIGDAMSEDARLAAARAGQDQHRAVRRPNRPLLLRVQASQDPLGEGVRGGLALGQSDRLGLERRCLHGLDPRPVESLRRSLVGRRRQLVRAARRGRLETRSEAVRIGAQLAALRPGV